MSRNKHHTTNFTSTTTFKHVATNPIRSSRTSYISYSSSISIRSNIISSNNSTTKNHLSNSSKSNRRKKKKKKKKITKKTKKKILLKKRFFFCIKTRNHLETCFNSHVLSYL